MRMRARFDDGGSRACVVDGAVVRRLLSFATFFTKKTVTRPDDAISDRANFDREFGFKSDTFVHFIGYEGFPLLTRTF